MAVNILVSGAGLVRTSFGGLMDRADPEVHRKLTDLLTRECALHGLSFHRSRHRHLGDAHWVDVHLVFPDDTSLAAAHREATRIEKVLEASLEPAGHVITHLESADDHDELHPLERNLPLRPDSN